MFSKHDGKFPVTLLEMASMDIKLVCAHNALASTPSKSTNETSSDSNVGSALNIPIDMPLFASVNESPFELSHNRRSDGPNGATSDASSSHAMFSALRSNIVVSLRASHRANLE